MAAHGHGPVGVAVGIVAGHVAVGIAGAGERDAAHGHRARKCAAEVNIPRSIHGQGLAAAIAGRGAGPAQLPLVGIEAGEVVGIGGQGQRDAVEGEAAVAVAAEVGIAGIIYGHGPGLAAAKGSAEVREHPRPA